MRQAIIMGTLLALGAVAAAACMPPEDSCDVKTQGIKVEFAAMEENGAAVGQAILWTDEGRAMVLGDCGDKITVNGVDVSVVDGTATPVVYTTGEIEATGTYDFVFSRPDEGDYTSTVTGLRPAVTITAPESGAEIPRDEPLEVTWDDNNGGEGNGEIDLVITGDCIDLEYEQTWTDDGADTVEADSLNVDGDTTSCTAELVLTRSVDGTLDPALNEVGSIKGWSMGRTTFQTVPTVE